MASTRSTRSICRINSRGVTLLELMITVANMAILGAVALPSFESALQSNRVATASNAFIASVNLGRSEAMRNNRGATVCPSAAGVLCDGGGDWAAGWIVFGSDGGSVRDVATDPLLFRQDRLQRLTMETVFNAANVKAPMLLFTPRGVPSMLDGGASLPPGDTTVQPIGCQTGNPFRRVITVIRSGAVRIATQNCP